MPARQAVGDVITRSALGPYNSGVQRFHVSLDGGRFDENPRFRAGWYLARHKSTAEAGRLNAELAADNGKSTVGRPREYDERAEQRMRELSHSGLGGRKIAEEIGGSARTH